MTQTKFKKQFSKLYRKAVTRQGQVITNKPMADEDIEKMFNIYVQGEFVTVKEFVKHVLLTIKNMPGAINAIKGK